MRSERTILARSACLLLVCVALVAVGCGDEEPAPKRPTPDAGKADPGAEKKAGMPDVIPGLKEAGLTDDGSDDDKAPGSMEVVVKGTYDRSERETYKWDPKFPAGTIKGGCRLVKKKGTEFPTDEIIQLTGANAIKDPAPKEQAYYENIGIKRRAWLSRMGRAKDGYTYIPYNVAVMLRDVKVGRRPPLSRPVMMVRHGVIQPGDNSNHGGGTVQFSPLHERAQFTTWDSFPSEIVVTRQGTTDVLFKQSVRYAQTENNKRKKNDKGPLVYKPQFITTPLIREPGMYVVTDARHPWMRGYLFVVDNPYVTVTTYHKYYPLCNFEIKDVPPGRHTLEVWHPLYKPVKRIITVTVEANKTTELMVKFHAPE